MPRPSIRTTILAAAAAFALGGGALVAAQPMPPAGAAATSGPAQLPETRGTVARHTLTPRGEVDGFLLRDGTQVHVPPHLSTQLVFAVRPGDAVTIRGLKALGAPLIAAVSVANDAGSAAVVDASGGRRGAQRPMEVAGRVQATLRGPRGEENGAVLEDGTILRLPPREAERFADLLQPGQAVAARGDGLSGPLGTVVEATQFGADADRLADVGGPPRDDRGLARPPRDDRGPRPPRCRARDRSPVQGRRGPCVAPDLHACLRRRTGPSARVGRRIGRCGGAAPCPPPEAAASRGKTIR